METAATPKLSGILTEIDRADLSGIIECGRMPALQPIKWNQLTGLTGRELDLSDDLQRGLISLNNNTFNMAFVLLSVVTNGNTGFTITKKNLTEAIRATYGLEHRKDMRNVDYARLMYFFKSSSSFEVLAETNANAALNSVNDINAIVLHDDAHMKLAVAASGPDRVQKQRKEFLQNYLK